ncbi:hypothetical protein FIBSPDRAFT_3684 [Athelia psychrophila]|uniref:Uncharacterized protein n=1 Tax=Athelia psychrophila TaxID=1759441 RepID=A0A166WZR3_9AGAM|nr:hypothetical protein FIBSPDRAFT_3684 [Fibularhizoctonia sp. CBS 109695]
MEVDNCHHCHNSLTRPEIVVRDSPITTSIGCQGLSPSQAAAVCDTVSATVADIAQIDEDIALYRSVTTRLESKRRLLASFAKAHKALLTPILRFPSEVLSEIFQQRINIPEINKSLGPRPGIDDDGGTRMRFTDSPLCLASVCRSWRTVALACPRLWSSISLTLRPKDCKRHIALLQLYFSRSKSSPLCINLESHDVYKNDMRNLMHVVASKSACWEHIRFRLSMPMWEAFPGTFYPSRLPMLSSLQLGVLEGENPAECPIQLFRRAPRLRYLHIDSASCRKTFSIPWDHIQEITISLDWMFLPEILNILMLVASNIVRCDLALFPRATEDNLGSLVLWRPVTFFQPPRSVHLPKLQSFSMSTTEGVNPTAFLSRLRMPVIDELSLVLDHVSAEDVQGSPHEEIMFIASSNRLRKLSVSWTRQGGRTAVEDTIQIIRASPDLRELHLTGDKYILNSDTILGNLAELDEARTPLFAPNIEILTIQLNHVKDFHPFLKALELRSSIGSRSKLRTIKLLTTRQWPGLAELPEDLEVEKRLRDIGVDVRRRSWYSPLSFGSRV